MSRKIVFYIKGNDRNIVITDDCSDGISDEELAKKISLQMSSTSIGWFETDGDIVIGFPGEISAVHIQKSKSNVKIENRKLDKKEYSFGDGFSSVKDIIQEELDENILDITGIESDPIDDDDIIKLEDITDLDEKVKSNDPRNTDLSDLSDLPDITSND